MPPEASTPQQDAAVESDGGAAVAVADYSAIEAGLDALELPQDNTGHSTLRRFTRSVLPPVVATVLVIVVWQILWAAAFWPEYQLPAPKAVGAELWHGGYNIDG